MPQWKAHARLRSLLDREGWTQARLAQALGVTSGAVSKWCSGDNDPGADGIESICRAVGLSADELLGLDLTGAWPSHRLARAQQAIAAVRAAGAALEEDARKR